MAKESTVLRAAKATAPFNSGLGYSGRCQATTCSSRNGPSVDVARRFNFYGARASVAIKFVKLAYRAELLLLLVTPFCAPARLFSGVAFPTTAASKVGQLFDPFCSCRITHRQLPECVFNRKDQALLRQYLLGTDDRKPCP